MSDPTVIGWAEVRKLLGDVAGCVVTEGSVKADHPVQVVRHGEPVWQGWMKNLRLLKDNVREVLEGYEFGCQLDFPGLAEGDLLAVLGAPRCETCMGLGTVMDDGCLRDRCAHMGVMTCPSRPCPCPAGARAREDLEERAAAQEELFRLLEGSR